MGRRPTSRGTWPKFTELDPKTGHVRLALVCLSPILWYSLVGATCKRARGAFDVSWRNLYEATLALGHVQHTATNLASDCHTAVEEAREASVHAQILWGRLPGKEAEDMVEYFGDASKALMADMSRAERRFATERQMAKEGTLFGIGFWTDLKMALKKCFTGPIIKLDASMVGATTKKDVEEM